MSGQVFLFPGQGSQYPGMARDICRYPRGSALLAMAEHVSGTPLRQTLESGSADRLAHPLVAQLGVLTHSLAALDYLLSTQPAPVIVSGHSLGEFSALVAAGVVDECEALELVSRRGRLMADAARESAGAMGAIAGLGSAAVTRLCGDSDRQPVTVANHNSPRQQVVSGRADAVDHVLATARAEGALRARRLDVGGAYHSPLMASAEEGMRVALMAANFRDPCVTLVIGSTGEVHSDGSEIRCSLARQITAPVRWTATMQTIARLQPATVTEVGPGRVLTGLAREQLRGMHLNPCRPPAGSPMLSPRSVAR